MSRIARIAEPTQDAEKARFSDAVDAMIRANSDESLDSLFERAGLDKEARQAALAKLYGRFGAAALTEDPEIARLASHKAVLSLLDTLVATDGAIG